MNFCLKWLYFDKPTAILRNFIASMRKNRSLVEQYSFYGNFSDKV